MASIINVRIVNESRAYYFITEFDIKHTWTEVDIDVLPYDSAQRFYTGILINTIEASDHADAIQKLEERLGFGGGSEGTGIAGHISIVDITPTSVGNVGGKVLSQDNHRIESAVSDTNEVRIHIVALTGPTNYKPNVTVNGFPVTIGEDNDKPLWNGYIDILVPESGLILAEHEDGAFDSAVISVEAPPVIQSAVFINGYPLGQTELKENDTFQLRVEADKPITRIEVLNQGATKYSNHILTASTSQVIQVTIADRGNIATLRGSTIRVYDENGSVSATYSTALAGSINGTNVVLVNNLHPSITIDAIDYPVGQQALKGSETADIAVSYFDTDTVLFDSPNNQLGIVDASLIEPIKEVSRISGTYNISTHNFYITGTRTANAASTTVSTVIWIADTTPSVSISAPNRLRSGGNQGTTVQNHVITLISNQRLLVAPTMENTPGAGTFIGSWTGGPTAYNRTMQVHDNDPKGTFNFTGFSTTNLAGIPVSSISGSTQYTLGGFVTRDLYFDPIQSEEPIGTVVTDVSKLSALDKDLIPMSYQPTTADSVRSYTITGPSGIPNTGGSILFWADETEVENNTTGGAFIRLEEVI